MIVVGALAPLLYCVDVGFGVSVFLGCSTYTSVEEGVIIDIITFLAGASSSFLGADGSSFLGAASPFFSSFLSSFA